MDQVEAALTSSWASFFIETGNKQQLLYEDFIAIYHAMYIHQLPKEPIANVAEFLATELKKTINLADCTLRDAEYQLKILVYLSCHTDCPTQVSTIDKIKCLGRDEQMLIVEIIQDIDGLIAAHANKLESRNNTDVAITNTPGKQQENAVIKTLEESFSNAPETEESWKEKYNALRLQHISDEAEIQELNDRLEQCYEEISLVKNENTHLQNQVVERNSMKLQLDDYKTTNADLVDNLDRAQKNISKMKLKIKEVAELEGALSEKEVEISKLKEDLAQAEKLNTQNQQARQEQRKEYQEKSRLQVENKTLQSLIEQLRAEHETLKQDRRQSLLPLNRLNNTDISFEALPSLADELLTAEEPPSNEEMEALKTENSDLKTNVESLEIGEKVMQDQIKCQVEELTELNNKHQLVELTLQRKSEQLESWKAMFQKCKYESEAKYDDVVHDHRQEMSKLRSNLNESLFITKKELLDKEAAIKKLERRVETQKTRAATTRPDYASPAPSTPLFIRRYRTPKTPSNIPRLILTPKRSYAKDVDDARMEEMSKRNQAVPPHMRSTYPVEVQYHEKPIAMDSTGRISNNLLTSSARYNSTLSKSSTTFEIPNSPKSRTKKREPLATTQPAKKECSSTKKENNPSVLLQFSPPKPNYKRRK